MNEMLRIQTKSSVKPYLLITDDGKFRGRLINYIFCGSFVSAMVGALVGNLLLTVL